jgi:glycosyltransferase involved in cell wall biosynthesis
MHDTFQDISGLIQELGLRNCVRLHESTSTVRGICHQGNAVVLPPFFEGLSNVACEALANGRPLLLRNVSNAGNLVRQGANGFFVDPRSEEEMARAIEEMAERIPSCTSVRPPGTFCGSFF